MMDTLTVPIVEFIEAIQLKLELLWRMIQMLIYVVIVRAIEASSVKAP